MDGFKLNNMVADSKQFYRLGRMMWIKQFFLCGQKKLCPPPYYLKPYTTIGSLVQIMLKLCCAHLISLHGRQAQTDRDGASNHKIDFLHNIRRFKFLKGIKIA